MNIFLIHSYNGDTEDSFAPSIEDFAKENQLDYYFPHFPIRKEASFEAWEKVMEMYLPLIKEDTIFIAHSLGTLFVPRFIAKYQLKPLAYMSVAGYMHYEGRKDLEEIMEHFYPSNNDFQYCVSNIPHRYAFYSDYDRMNDRTKLVEYAHRLKAEEILVEGAGHFDPASKVEKIKQLNDLLVKLIQK